MVLIISQTHEPSTDQVIDWIDYYRVPFKRMNGIDFYQGIYIELANSHFDIYLNNERIDWNKFGVVWYRRWVGYENRHEYLLKQIKNALDPIKFQLNQFLRKELMTLVSFFFKSIPPSKIFGRADNDELNKLFVLKKAQELDILIPATYILTSKDHFNNISKDSRLITKAIYNSPSIEHLNEHYSGYTSLVDEFPEELDALFSASLFQKQIRKKYEIRAFLLDRKFFSMAIFSQADPQTELDFRMYNYEYPNRTVPYKLPTDLECKLIKLADFFQLKAGSFDIIKTIDNKYVFLEINVEGQFGMVSYPCNYYLEKKIAQSLTNHKSEQ